MKKLTNFIFVFFLYSIGFAQEIPLPKITKSEIFKDKYKDSNIQLIANDGKDGVIIVRSESGGFIIKDQKGFIIELFDSNLKLKGQVEILKDDFPKEIKNYNFLGVVTNNDKVHVIGYYFNKKTEKYTCSANTTSILDNKFTETILFEVEDFKKQEGAGTKVLKGYASLFGVKSDYTEYANFLTNNSKDAFAIKIAVPNKVSEKFKLFSFSSNLDKKVECEYDSKIKASKFDFKDFELSPNGDYIYLLSKIETENNKSKDKGGKYQLNFTKLNSTSQKTISMSVKNHFCDDVTILTNKNFLKCVGFYSDKNDYRYKGIAVYNIDFENFTIINTKFNPFTPQFIEDKYGKLKDKELRNLEIDNFKINDNNEIIFNAEERYITTTYQHSMNGMGGTTTTYHFNDIVSAKIDTENNLIWARNINKKQSTNGINSDFFSFTSASVGINNYLFINSSEKPRKITNNRIEFKESSRNRSNINMIRFDEKGDFDFIEILDDKQNEMPFLIGRGVQIENSVYFIGRDGKKKQLLKVTI